MSPLPVGGHVCAGGGLTMKRRLYFILLVLAILVLSAPGFAAKAANRHRGSVIGCEAARTGRREKEPEGKRRRRSCERRPRLSTRQEDLVALQLPPPCGLVHVPDIDVPRTLPLY